MPFGQHIRIPTNPECRNVIDLLTQKITVIWHVPYSFTHSFADTCRCKLRKKMASIVANICIFASLYLLLSYSNDCYVLFAAFHMDFEILGYFIPTAKIFRYEKSRNLFSQLVLLVKLEIFMYAFLHCFLCCVFVHVQ